MTYSKFESIFGAENNMDTKAASTKVKHELMNAICEKVKALNLTQIEAAKKLGITQPRLNDLLRGRITRFSLGALYKIFHAANNKNDYLSPKLSKYIKQLKSNDKTLTSIGLWNENIGNQGLEAIAAALKINHILDSIFLMNNNIGEKGSKIIAEILKVNTTLTEIDLSKNNIGVYGTKVIAEALKSNTSLESIDLTWNGIESEGASALSNMLKVNMNLNSIDLSKNNLGAEGIKMLSSALKNNTTLISIELYWNNIGSDGAKAIADVIMTNTSLTSIGLSNNNIEIDGAKAIAEALMFNTTLASINLENNNIGIEGAKVIANALKTNTTLTSISLCGNDIKYEGARAISEALIVNTSLTAISLSWNNIEIEGARCIFDALKFNKSLAFLDLSRNNIGDDKIKIIFSSLKENVSLKTINLIDNKIDKIGGNAILSMLRENDILIDMGLFGNNIPREIHEKIADKLDKNHSLWQKKNDAGNKFAETIIKTRELEKRANPKSLSIIKNELNEKFLVCYPYLDKHFISEINANEQQKKDERLWEIILTYKLIKNPKIKNLFHNHEGPDLYFTIGNDNKKFYLEATCAQLPKENQDSEIWRVKKEMHNKNKQCAIVGNDFYDEIAIRFSNAISRKLKNQKKFMQDKDAGYILCVASPNLSFASLPEMVKTVIPTGSVLMNIHSNSKKTTHHSYSNQLIKSTDEAGKKNTIPTDVFGNEDYSWVSAIMFSSVELCLLLENSNLISSTSWGPINNDFILIHNPVAKFPLPENIFNSNTVIYLPGLELR